MHLFCQIVINNIVRRHPSLRLTYVNRFQSKKDDPESELIYFTWMLILILILNECFYDTYEQNPASINLLM